MNSTSPTKPLKQKNLKAKSCEVSAEEQTSRRGLQGTCMEYFGVQQGKIIFLSHCNSWLMFGESTFI